MTKYVPSPRDWVREQVELYESSGGTKGTTLRDTGLPVIIVTHTGNKTGAIRKTPLATPTRLNRPELAIFWGEPLLGPVSYMSLPEFYGEPPYQMTEAEQANYKKFLDEEYARWTEWLREKRLRPRTTAPPVTSCGCCARERRPSTRTSSGRSGCWIRRSAGRG